MTQEPLILAFDTATRNCSIALTAGSVSDGTVIGAVTLNAGITHSRRLLDAIDWLLHEAHVDLDELAAVAVGLGPGSFTGLRIGLATAKGLCHGTGKPLLGIVSLDSIAATVQSERLVCVAIDARKKEVYSCFYRCGQDGVARRCAEPVVIGPAELAAVIDEPVIMAGDGVTVYHSLWQELLGEKMLSAPARCRFPGADMVGLLASDEYRDSRFLDLAEAKPFYVRSSDAELSLVQPGKPAVAAKVKEHGKA